MRRPNCEGIVPFNWLLFNVLNEIGRGKIATALYIAASKKRKKIAFITRLIGESDHPAARGPHLLAGYSATTLHETRDIYQIFSPNIEPKQKNIICTR